MEATFVPGMKSRVHRLLHDASKLMTLPASDWKSAGLSA
jgi:hypothetical protein